MPNVTSILNEHVCRLARREIKSNTRIVRKATAQYRRDIAALKRQMAELQKTVVFLQKQEERRGGQAPAVPEDVEGIRFRADGLRSHRAKLGLSAKDYGRLVEVSPLTIYQWEGGKAKPRMPQLAKLAAVRGIGKREAMKRLEAMGVTTGRTRGRYDQTAEEFVTSLVKSRKATTSNQINAAWTKAGRPGRADNTISRMVRQKMLKRAKLKGQRGSSYAVA